MAASQCPKPHFVVIPWPATSHMIPIVDIACLLAGHGAPVTVITTPASAQLVQSLVERAGQGSSAGVTVTAIPFPAAEAGLPDGCERLDHTPSVDLVSNFFDATARFGDAVARHCRGLMATRRPDCIVAGMCNTWAHGLARELGAPCFIFHGFGAFALLCCEYLNTHRPHEAAASLDELLDVPVLPPFEFKFARRQLPLQFLPSCSIPEVRLRELREFEMAVDGIVVNSFEELEHGSAARLAAATGKAVFAVGPVSLCGAPGLLDSRADSDDARRCMAWLDAKQARSVLYVSFGSAGRMPPAQVMQLGMALVSCPWPVLWVIKGADSLPDDVNEWLQDNTDANGLPASQCLAVRGWAPQVPILEHPAVGGFLTHCGWGSTLESVAAGVPMATWPFTAEQFLNEKLIVDVLRVGVSVGVTKPTEGVLTGVRPVLWVIKGADSLPDDVNEWLQDNTDANGLPASQCLAVRGWAPQVPILEHPAVGGFLTHCGWGSTLESVAAGVPMATWPFTAEQFLNEKLIVDVLRVGVSVGVTKPTEGVLTGVKSGGGTAKADVGAEQVKQALDMLMDGGVGGEARRAKAEELKAKAKAALQHGGSSYMNLDKLIQFAG